MTPPNRFRGALALMCAIFLVYAYVPSASAQSPPRALEIVGFGPSEDTHGFLTCNPDNTYYPGDFFYAEVDGFADDDYGWVSGEWKTVQTENEVDDYWHDETEKIVAENESYFVYDNFSEAEAKAEEMQERSPPDILWGVEKDTHYHVWRANFDWRIRVLKVVPLVFVGVDQGIRASTGSFEVSDGSGDREPTVVCFEVEADTPPREYEVRFTLKKLYPVPGVGPGKPAPNPSAEDIVVSETIEVVEYSPVVRAIPYVQMNWGVGEVEWICQKPYAIITRYDGDGDPVNPVENLYTGGRAVVSAISVEGAIVKPLYASHAFPRTRDDGVSDYENENSKTPHIVAGEDITLAKEPNGDYYGSGALLSPVFDMRVSTKWVRGEFDILTLDGTGAKLYIRAGDDMSELLRAENGWWDHDEIPLYGDRPLDVPKGRYAQYKIILWTENPDRTPTVFSAGFRWFGWSSPLTEGYDDRYDPWVVDNWLGGPGVELVGDPRGDDVNTDLPQGPTNFNTYYATRDPIMYYTGDPIHDDAGVQKTGTIALKTRFSISRWGSSVIVFELEPEELGENIRGKTMFSNSPGESSPPMCGLFLDGIRAGEDYLPPEEVDNAGIFPFKSESVVKYLRAGGGDPLWSFLFSPYRYHKWKFGFYPADSNGYDQWSSWVADVEISFDVTMWFRQEVPWDGGTRKSYKKIFSSELLWNPMGLEQPVRVAAWELEPWARARVDENPELVYQDNAWRIDEDVSFEVKFVDVFDAENFLETCRQSAEMLKPMAENEEALRNLWETLDNIIRSLPPELTGGVELGFVEDDEFGKYVKDAIMSVASMDDRMLQMILEDLEFEDTAPQVIFGKGEATGVIEFWGVNYFALSEDAWIDEGDIRNVSKPVQLPFDPREENYLIDINLTGDGMVAEVVEDSGGAAKIVIHNPPRSGGLKEAMVRDNEGNELCSLPFIPFEYEWVLGVFGVTEPSTTTERTITFYKWENSPDELHLTMTNSWGASRVQVVEVLPGAPYYRGGALRGDCFFWLFLAVVFAAAWSAFVHHWRTRRRSSAVSGDYAGAEY